MLISVFFCEVLSVWPNFNASKHNSNQLSHCPTDCAIMYHTLITKACSVMKLNQSGIKFATWPEHDLVTVVFRARLDIRAASAPTILDTKMTVHQTTKLF